MELFVGFDEEQQKQIKSRFDEFLGKVANTEQSYFDLFEHDLKSLNEHVAYSAQETQFERKAFECQEEYNQALENARVRWSKCDKDYQNGAIIIKDLTVRRKNYEKSLDEAHLYEKKLELIDSYTHSDVPWARLQAKLKGEQSQVFKRNTRSKENKEIDEKGIEKLKEIQHSWQAQGELAKGNTKDILNIIAQLDNFSVFLDFIQDSFNSQSTHPSDKKILANLEINRQIIKNYRLKCQVALGWRILSAINAGNLRCDDGLLGLMTELKKNVLQNIPQGDLDDISEFITLPSEVKTFEMSFEDFVKALRIVGYQQWINSRWVQNKDNANLIQVIVRDDLVIPQKLESFIPLSPSLTPDSWIRNWFFRTSSNIPSIRGWLRHLCVGNYQESITYINETYRQLVHFESLIESYRKEGYGLNLNYIITNPAFAASLDLPKVIGHELKRARFFRPSWFFGRVLSFIPFFNRFASYQFFSLWHNELIEAKKTISLKYQKIAQFIVEDFETLMLNSIQAKSFTFDKELICTLERFIKIYAKPEDVEKFNKLSDPVSILQKFDFLLEDKQEDKLYRNLNEDAIISFISFAEKYWPKDKVEAIKAIIELINRSDLPTNEQEDKQFMEKINCLFDVNKKAEFARLMNIIARKYLFETGDDGNPKVYHFLQRHAPEAAKSWKARRQMDIEDKFILINKILTDGLYKEIDLRSDEEYGTGNTKLPFKNYALYINDIQAADHENSTQYYSILIKQANKYIEKYNGDNSRYADLINIFSCSHISLIKNYFEKRIFFLFDEKNSKDIMVNQNDFHMFKEIGKSPLLVKNLCTFLEKQYKGDNLEHAELMLGVNCPQVISLYFGKHFDWLLSKGEFKKLLADKELYQEYLTYPEFVKHLEGVISNYIEKLSGNNDWEKLESKELSALVEHYGTLQNKEAYRLLRIERLINKNDSNSTRAYLSHVSQFLEGKLEDNLITLPNQKARLDTILIKQVKRLMRRHEWRGHTQYFLEYFISDNKKNYLYDFRLAWLSDYLMHKEKFADVNELERSYMEAKFHYQNKEVPHEEKDLSKFYSSQNATKVKQVVMRALDSFENPMNDEQIALLRQYFKDNLFTFSEEWTLFTKKFELYQKMLKINCAINCGKFVDAIQNIEDIIDSTEGLEQINAVSPQAQREQIINYNKKIVEKLSGNLVNCFKSKLVNEEILDKIDGPTIQEAIKILAQQRINLFGLLNRSKLPDSLKKDITDCNDNAEHIISSTCDFVKTLNFKTLHLILPLTQTAELFNKYLTDDVKTYLAKRIAVICGFLTNDDPLYEALNAMVRLIENKYVSSSSKNEDLAILSKYSIKRRNYPEVANGVANKLIILLNERKPLHDCTIFNDLKGSYQSAFIHDMSMQVKKLLNRTLKAKIEWLMCCAPVPSNTDQRLDWAYHGRLFEWLSSGISADDLDLKFKVHEWTEHCLDTSKKSLQALIDKFDNVISNKNNTFSPLLKAEQYFPKAENLQDEKQLLKAALFVRTFGDELQKKALDKLLQEVARRQRKMMMNGLSGPFVEYCLDHAGLIINITGSEKQRLECAHLMDTWNRYCAVSLTDVRALAILDAIPQYILDFDNCIFQYFIKKHDLNENFTQVMISKIEEWSLKDELVEPKELLKKHPISEFYQILLEQYRKQKHGLFHSGPSMNDAEKLFVAFCLTLQAHQLAQIWQKRQQAQVTSLRQFKPEDISESLNALVLSLGKTFKIGRGSFNHSVARAIHKDTENFASWSVIEPEDKEQMRVKLKIAKQ
ncbi:MAG: hypothetical protein JSR17_08285 [Proteobacteria bacterium]|nr:hypothetical protein [Pseudomonadota bacterium]